MAKKQEPRLPKAVEKPKRERKKKEVLLNNIPLSDLKNVDEFVDGEVKNDLNRFILDIEKDDKLNSIKNDKLVGTEFQEIENLQESNDKKNYLRQMIREIKGIENSNSGSIHWDVKIGDEIEYFDPELSYELTGYRPITETKGLDFHPDPFRDDAIVKMNTGKYTSYTKGGSAYYNYWKSRYERCTKGYTYNNYTITGDHYFFLNFYALPLLKKNINDDNSNIDIDSMPEIEYGFPFFIKEQYVYFHYVKMAEMLGKDVAALKSRGVKSCPPIW